MPSAFELPLIFNDLEELKVKWKSEEWQIPWKERKFRTLHKHMPSEWICLLIFFWKTERFSEQGCLRSPELKDKGQVKEEGCFQEHLNTQKFTNLRKSLNLSELWDLLRILSIHEW